MAQVMKAKREKNIPVLSGRLVEHYSVTIDGISRRNRSHRRKLAAPKTSSKTNNLSIKTSVTLKSVRLLMPDNYHII